MSRTHTWNIQWRIWIFCLILYQESISHTLEFKSFSTKLCLLNVFNLFILFHLKVTLNIYYRYYWNNNIFTSTCPTNTITNVGTGNAYSCCSSANCNTGTVAVTSISCYSGSSATSVTATAGCTTLCQVMKIEINTSFLNRIYFNFWNFFTFKRRPQHMPCIQ